MEDIEVILERHEHRLKVLARDMSDMIKMAGRWGHLVSLRRRIRRGYISRKINF